MTDVPLREALTTEMECLRREIIIRLEERDKALLLAAHISETKSTEQAERHAMIISVIISIIITLLGHFLK